jgi:hypothetical protein
MNEGSVAPNGEGDTRRVSASARGPLLAPSSGNAIVRFGWNPNRPLTDRGAPNQTFCSRPGRADSCRSAFGRERGRVDASVG